MAGGWGSCCPGLGECEYDDERDDRDGDGDNCGWCMKGRNRGGPCKGKGNGTPIGLGGSCMGRNELRAAQMAAAASAE